MHRTKNQLKDPRKLPHKPAPAIIPEELVGKATPCEKCGTSIEIPWLEKLEFPSQPIKSAKADGYWVPVSIPLICPDQSCNHKTLMPVPTVPTESIWSLFGDEAGRHIQDPKPSVSKRPLHFFCITLVGIHQDEYERVKAKIERIKASIRPNDSPDAWPHHFTEIMNSSPGDGEFNLPTKSAKIAHGKRLAKIIRDARPALVSFTISGCIVVPEGKNERKKAINWHKQEIFSQTILSTLKQMRRHHKGVRWVFDNVSDSTSKTPTEGWAYERFLGLQYTRLFTWLSAGSTVTEPEFIKPGSHFISEIADFISYCVAREFEKSTKGKKSEFPTSRLGMAFYQGNRGDGSVHYKWSERLPLQYFYGL